MLGQLDPADPAETECQEKAVLQRDVFNGTISNRSMQPGDLDPKPGPDLARCFLLLANLATFVLDRLSRYEVLLRRRRNQ